MSEETHAPHGFLGGAGGDEHGDTQSSHHIDTSSQSASSTSGAVIEVLHADDVVQEEVGEAKIRGCKCIASFNWLDGDRPSIAVPGCPPAWTPLPEPRQLEKDASLYFRDPNAARSPNHPFEPAVRALLAENESFETQKIDLVACSSTLGSLLRFLRGDSSPFRFLVHVVGSTVFFVRRENTPTEYIDGINGYGHTFPEAYTTWDAEVAGSASSQRLLNYDFAGLNCILRFECDGYLKGECDTEDSRSRKPKVEENVEEHSDPASNLENIMIPADSMNVDGKDSLQVQIAGRKIPQDAIFELKTRAIYNTEDMMKRVLSRCWLAQIPWFVFGGHEQGLFKDIKVEQVIDDVKDWEIENQDVLKRFSWLIRKIISATKARQDGKLEVRCKTPNAIELRKQVDDHDVLPPELRLRWMDGHDSTEAKESERDDTGGDDGPEPDFDTDDSYTFHEPYHPDDSGISDTDSEKDYTACSAEDCGYCGHCKY